MKYCISLVVLMFTQMALAEIHLFLPGIQIRYQDSITQAREQKVYQNYSVQYQYDYYLIGLEHNKLSEESGNSSLRVESLVSETLLIAGYSFWSLNLEQLSQNEKKFGLARFELVLQSYLGQTQTRVKTILLSQSTTNNSQEDTVIGLGGNVLFKFGYFLASFDARYLQSKNFSPNWVPLANIKIGLNLNY